MVTLSWIPGAGCFSRGCLLHTLCAALPGRRRGAGASGRHRIGPGPLEIVSFLASGVRNPLTLQKPQHPFWRICVTHSKEVNCDQTCWAGNEAWRTAQLLLKRDCLTSQPTGFLCGLVISLPCTFLREMLTCENWSLFYLNTIPFVSTYTFDVLFSSFDFALQCSCYLWETSGECLRRFIKCFIKLALLKETHKWI